MGGGIIIPTLIITEYFWQLIKWMLFNTNKGKDIIKELEELEREINEKENQTKTTKEEI